MAMGCWMEANTPQPNKLPTAIYSARSSSEQPEPKTTMDLKLPAQNYFPVMVNVLGVGILILAPVFNISL